MRAADSVSLSFSLTHKPPPMYDARGILCSVFVFLYEEGHSYSHQIHHPSPVLLNFSRQLDKQSYPSLLQHDLWSLYPGLDEWRGPLEWCPPYFSTQSVYVWHRVSLQMTESVSLADVTVWSTLHGFPHYSCGVFSLFCKKAFNEQNICDYWMVFVPIWGRHKVNDLVRDSI